MSVQSFDVPSPVCYKVEGLSILSKKGSWSWGTTTWGNDWPAVQRKEEQGLNVSLSLFTSYVSHFLCVQQCATSQMPSQKDWPEVCITVSPFVQCSALKQQRQPKTQEIFWVNVLSFQFCTFFFVVKTWCLHHNNSTTDGSIWDSDVYLFIYPLFSLIDIKKSLFQEWPGQEGSINVVTLRHKIATHDNFLKQFQ